MKKSTTTGRIVKLSDPIAFGDTTLSEIKLRQPTAGDLRGTKLGPLIELDTDQLLSVIPRISDPHVSESQLGQLSPRDLLVMAGEFAHFFAPDD